MFSLFLLSLSFHLAAASNDALVSLVVCFWQSLYSNDAVQQLLTNPSIPKNAKQEAVKVSPTTIFSRPLTYPFSTQLPSLLYSLSTRHIPHSPPPHKQALMDKSGYAEATKNFFSLCAENNRLADVADITAKFEELQRAAKGLRPPA